MSWATVSSALSTRIGAVSGVGRVHTYWRWSRDNPEDAAWQTLFVSSNVVNAWMIQRVGRARTVPATPANDRSARYLIRHDVEVDAFYAVDDSAATEATFQALVDAVAANLRTGDRTLGGVAITYSLPESSPINYDASLSGVLCHHATLAFTVEEIV